MSDWQNLVVGKMVRPWGNSMSGIFSLTVLHLKFKPANVNKTNKNKQDMGT